MKTYSKDDTNYIGIYRGIEQYEIKSDTTLLLLKLGNNYYLSRAKSVDAYNANILQRISNFYVDGCKALGELVEVK